MGEEGRRNGRMEEGKIEGWEGRPGDERVICAYASAYEEQNCVVTQAYSN